MLFRLEHESAQSEAAQEHQTQIPHQLDCPMVALGIPQHQRSEF